MTYCRCYSCKYLLRYELKTECGQIFANFFGMNVKKTHKTVFALLNHQPSRYRRLPNKLDGIIQMIIG